MKLIQLFKSGTPPYFYPPKPFVIMKLVILLTIICLQVSARAVSQQITIAENDIPIEKVFKSLRKQTGYSFFYKVNLLQKARPVNLNLKGVTLEEALSKCFEGQPFTYEILNKTVIIKPKEVSVIEIQKTFAATKVELNITGKVTSEAGEPLIGVTVVLKGTTRGTSTDVTGSYAMAVPDNGGTLVFSYIGFLTKEVAIGNATSLNVILAPDAKALEEVVVVGYGSVKKSDLTGSVVSLGGDKLKNLPMTNALEGLQGRVAGVDLTRSSGEAGAGLNITIRGNRSLTAGNGPLVIVDGIAYGSYIDINPNDISSVEVLKDASATAIYGSRGANGVIIITTKGGQSGKTKIEVNSYAGPNLLTDYERVANTGEFVEFRRQAYRTTGIWNGPADDNKIFTAQELQNINAGVNTDWVDKMVHHGFVQNYHLAASGGNDKTVFRLSSEIFKEDGLLKNDYLNRYVQHANLDHKISDKVKIGTILNFNYSKQNRRNTSFFNLIKNLPFGNPYNADGTLALYPIPGSTNLNPLLDESLANFKDETLSKRLFITAFADWEILKGLNFRSSYGADFGDSDRGIFEGKNSTLAFNNQGFSRSEKYNQSYFNWTWNNVLTHQKEFGRHSLQSTLGTELIANRSTFTRAQGKNQPFESAWFYNLGTNTTNLGIESGLTESQLASYFGRFNYKYNDRYLVTFTFRADGASVLAKGNKWAYFPSTAISWKLNEENFLKGGTTISDLKLRASFGLVGNAAIQPYQTSGRLGRTGYAFDETAAFGYRPHLLGVSTLGWEKTRTTNIALDYGLFNNRISGSLDFYQTRTTDLLMERILPNATGYSNVIDNIGETQTRGVDLMLSTVNVESDKFQWTSDFSVTYNTDKIVALSTGSNDVNKGWFIGQPINVFYDYEKTGIWQSNELDAAKIYNQSPGQIKVKDQNGDNKITANEDRVILGRALPNWTGSLMNTFNYGNFNLAVLLYGRQGNLIRSEYGGYFRNSMGENTTVVDYWTPENPTNAYPRPSSSGPVLYQSTLLYKDASFLKIKDIRLSYTLSDNKTKLGPLNSLQVFATAKNFFTFSKFDNYDPERGGSVSYPLTKQLVFGVNLGL